MNKEELIALKEKLSKLSEEEKKQRDLYLRDIALGKIQGPMTGYASIDKPWLKHYPSDLLLSDVSEKGIYDFLLSRNHNLNTVAINYFGNKITFGDFFKRIDTVSKSFLEMGIKEGDIVSIMLANTPENVISIYALNKIGAIPNMIDLRQKENKLVHYINSSDSKMVICTDLFLNNLDEVANEINVDKIVVSSPFDSMPLPLELFIKMTKKQYKPKNLSYIKWKDFERKGLKSNLSSNYKSNSEDPACIVHTSGTTGIPKGVVLTNRCFNAMVLEYKDVIVKTKTGDKILCQVPPFLAYSAIMALHLPLSLGVSLEMLPDYQPEKFADNIYKHKTAHAVAGPADWNNFLSNEKVSKRDYSFLVTMGSGSDKIDTNVRHRIDEVLSKSGCKSHVFEGYGMTEVGSAAVTNLPYYIVDDSVGIPLAKMSVMIYDNENDCELPYNSVGEICLSGSTMMKEYYKNPEATNDTIRLHSDGKYWVHSGDYGYINSDGNLFLKGRIKRIIVTYEGFKVSPNDIEKVLMNTGLVSECCAVGIKDNQNGYGAIPVANVVLNKNAFLEDENEIVKKLEMACAVALTERYRPRNIIVRDSLPMTDVGKIDYRALEDICNSEQCVKIKKK